MKKLLFALALTSSLISCKKETTNPNSNGNSNTTDTTKNSTIGKPGPNITDVEGNTYKTVTIGNQTWMAENLKTAKYNDGTIIPNLIENNHWVYSLTDTMGGWCYYNNDESNNLKYGKLYNWYVVNPTSNGNKNVCPTGWHVPSNAEWKTLTDYLGGDSTAGSKMKESGNKNWMSDNLDATNSSLFTGLPGGYRNNSSFFNLGSKGYWHSTSEHSYPGASWGLSMYGKYKYAYKSDGYKNDGISIRCIRD